MNLHDLPSVVSYLYAALVLLLTLGFAMRARFSTDLGAVLVPTLLANVVWASILAWDSHTGWLGAPGHYFVELLRYGGLLALMWVALPRETNDSWLDTLPRVIVTVWVALMLAGAAVAAAIDTGLMREWPSLLFATGGLVCALLVLVAAEQVGRNRSPAAYWAIKHLLTAVGLLAGYDIVLFSATYLFSDVPAALWQARGFANAIGCIPLAFGIDRLRKSAVEKRVGAAGTFFTTVMLLAGIYLFLVAIIGTYVRSFNGTWGGAMEVAVLVGGVTLLAVVAFSAEARAVVRVFVQKYFVAQKYDYREEWLRFVRTLDGDGPARDRTELAERVLQAMANITGSPNGGLWVHTEDDKFVPVAGRLCGDHAPTFSNERTAEHWVELLTQNNWILDVDGQLPPGLQRDQIPEWLRSHRQVWLVVPLGVAGRVEGLMVLEPPLSSDRTLTWEDLDLLRTAATQAAGSLALQRALDDIGQLQQFEAFNRLVAFLMHDLKNVLAQQQLVVKNFPRFRHNPEFIDDAILTVDNATQRMARLIEQLKSGTSSPQRRRFRFDEACREALRSVGDRSPKPVAVHLPEVSVSGDPERLRSALVHLLRNAQDATAAGGEVSFHASFSEGLVTVVIADTGEGMNEEFIRNRLFKPFDSTKGVMGMGVGAYQAREYVRELGGDLQVSSRPAAGTRFTLTIPALVTDDIGELALAAS